MALINCKECGKEISESATVCPHCGCKTTFGIEKAKLTIHAVRNLVDIGVILLGGIVAIVGIVPFAENLDRLERWISSDDGVVGTFAAIGIGVGLVIAGFVDIKKQQNEVAYRRSEEIRASMESQRSAPSSAAPAGSWTCSCGRKNANYTSTCCCGKHRRDIIS